ncbi:unnamed protein product [Trichogramma brassicae]|uniref:Uncharacterized protein n=1 Tax=Trichogramma brassicae TaxID=86971 RepID=A0A6H5IB64_9HYME|nr:unnamed protein product [Trichogramma brassicae]
MSGSCFATHNPINIISNEVLDYKNIIAGLRSLLNDARFEIAQLRKELEESNKSNANASNKENRAYAIHRFDFLTTMRKPRHRVRKNDFKVAPKRLEAYMGSSLPPSALRASAITLRLGRTEYQTPLSRSPLSRTLTSSCRCTRRACGPVSSQRARKGRSMSCYQRQASPPKNHRRTGRSVCWTQRARFSKESSVTASKPLLRAMGAS